MKHAQHTDAPRGSARRRPIIMALVLAFDASLLGCQWIYGIEDTAETARQPETGTPEGGSPDGAPAESDASGGSTGGPDGGVSGSGGTGEQEECARPCGSLEQCSKVGGKAECVAKLVTVTGGYAIDATEVTRSQYEAWLSTNPSTGGQRSECSWNTVFSPASGCMSGERVCQGSGCGQHPQVCVDWCDAVAYCQGVGKRLCGKIGGGANAYGDYKDATKSQWYKACTSDGQNGYPYLDAYSAQACNGWDKGIQTTVETGSLRICQSSSSGYKGVYDLSGNVWEWEDSCSDTYGLSDNCRLRGGSFNRDDIGLRCDSDSDSDFLSRDPTGGDVIGFRCCSP